MRTAAPCELALGRRLLSFFFRLKTCSRRAGRGLKRSLEAVGFVLAEFQPKRSHGDPIRDIFRVNSQDARKQETLVDIQREYPEEAEERPPVYTHGEPRGQAIRIAAQMCC